MGRCYRLFGDTHRGAADYWPKANTSAVFFLGE
jgi:hypothetical protein